MSIVPALGSPADTLPRSTKKSESEERAELVAAWEAEVLRGWPKELPPPDFVAISKQFPLTDGACTVCNQSREIPPEWVGRYVCSACKARRKQAAHSIPPSPPPPNSPPTDDAPDERRTFADWFGPPPCRVLSSCDEGRLLTRFAELRRELPASPPRNATRQEVDAYISALKVSEEGFGRLLGEINLFTPLEVEGIGDKSTPEGRFALDFVRHGVNYGRVLALDLCDRWVEDGVCMLGDEAEACRIRLNRHRWESEFNRSVYTLSRMAEPERQPHLDAIAALIQATLVMKLEALASESCLSQNTPQDENQIASTLSVQETATGSGVSNGSPEPTVTAPSPTNGGCSPSKRDKRATAKAALVRYWEGLSSEDRAKANRETIAREIKVSTGLTSALMKELGYETKGMKEKGSVEPRTTPLNGSILAVLPARAESAEDEAMAKVVEYIRENGAENLLEVAELHAAQKKDTAKENRRHETQTRRRHDGA